MPFALRRVSAWKGYQEIIIGASATYREEFHVKPLAWAEYDDRSDEVRQAETYCEIESLRLEMGFKFGWTAQKFRQIFGEWPPGILQTYLPIPASPAERKWITAEYRRYKRLKAKEAGPQNDRKAQKALKLLITKRGKKNGRDTGGAVFSSVAKTKHARRGPGGN